MGLIGAIFSLLFKQKGSNQSSVQLQQGSNDGNDRIQIAVTRMMERQSINPAAATELLNSEFVKGKLSEALRDRIELAIEKASEAQGGSSSPERLAGDTTSAPTQPVVTTPSAADAWKPDALTTGDANWEPDAKIGNDDPWHPDAGRKQNDPWHPDTTKRNDPWHPDTGSKRNDPWHPGS